LPSSMMQIFAVVAPMSNDRMRSLPMFSAIQVDRITPPAGGHFIQEHVHGAEYAEFHAAHLSNVQAGAAFSDRVLAFLSAN